jgi:hypothetical protein
MYNGVERSVLDHDRLSNGEQLVTRDETRLLIASGYYGKSTGSPYGATHFRRSLSDGSCLHLVIEEHRRRLHHDTFDPHAGLFALGMHLTHEAKSEAVSCCAMAWSLVKLLAR